MYGYIYKTTNLISNKIYIGQKKSKYFLGNKYLGSGKKLHEAIKHYGKEAFNVTLLEQVDSMEELDKREIYWINYYKATDNSIGYNISEGGISNRTMRGVNHPMYGRKRIGSDNPAYGRHWWTNGVEQVYQKECPNIPGWHHGVADYVKENHSKASKGKRTWNKGLTKQMDSRLNGNHYPRTESFKQYLSQINKGDKNHMYGKYGNLQYKYIYDGKEFIGNTAMVNYLNSVGFINFTRNNLRDLMLGKKAKKFPMLDGKIKRVLLNEDELKREKHCGTISKDL